MSNWKGFKKLDPIRGWLFDIYSSGPDEVTVWIIAESGDRVQLTDKFIKRIYISGKTSALTRLIKKAKESSLIASWRFVEKNSDFMKPVEQKVLEIGLADYTKASRFAVNMLKLGENEKFRFHNVDVSASQAYLYTKDVFPFAHVMAVDSGKRIYYDLLDSVESVEYPIPSLRSLKLKVNMKKEGASRKLTDKLESLLLEFENKTLILDKGSEMEKILKLVQIVKEEDPDLIFTEGGDSFVLSYLAHRAFVNDISGELVLSRDNTPLKAITGQGVTVFSYGQVYHKAPTQRLFGRVHIDVNNTFVYTACGLEGLIEVSRTCRFPLHQAARASIGTIMSSLQLYTALKDNILIPWKKNEPEFFKTAWELLVADRGGCIFEPKIGFHTDVFEVDFISMFPMLMLTRNISAETVLCKCCPNSNLRVPELEYNICEKRKGIVPKTLELLLKKRLKYKNLAKEAEDENFKNSCDRRQAALKWILVTSFGYLGYRNARFGKVDAHIAVCAFARDLLLKTVRLAEQCGFEVIHGIVDSLWLKKPNASSNEVANFCHSVSDLTGIPLEAKGKYRWIVFLPSKILENVPVLNRYYGVFENGRVKMKGIEARRRDTPLFIVKAQTEIIKRLAGADSFGSFNEKISEVLLLLRDYAEKLIEGQIDLRELLITKRLSISPSNYNNDVLQAIAAKQLKKAGFEVHPGQTVQYLIVDTKSKWINKRVAAAQLLRPNIHYDINEYIRMLISAGDTLIGIFGYTKRKIAEIIISHNEQITL